MKPWMAVLLGVVLGGYGGRLAADSPLTSTDLASAYSELPAVRQALETHSVSGAVLAFLVGDRPTDQKAAVVNAVGWKTHDAARAFVEGVARARGVDPRDLKLAQLTAADRFVLGYLRALETYAEPAPLQAGALDLWGATPLQLLDQATQSLPNDFTVHYVRSLLEAQRAMADSGCSAYTATARVLERFPVARRNLRPAALAASQGYMELYKKDCEKAPVAAPKPGATTPLTPEHDQVYALARLGETIVAGTQAGVVVWGADHKRPVAHSDEKICSSVVVWHDAAWAGCYGRLVRWDGATWKSYLQDPAATDGYSPLIVEARDELLVYRDAAVWRYEPDHDRFIPVSGFGAPTHYALVRRNEDLWRIVFMDSVVGPDRKYRRQSSEYAGRDPRTLIEDATGRLWVADFDSGFFRLDEATGEFVHEGVIKKAAVTLAVDKARGRTFFLHYTEGPTIQDDTRSELVDLHVLGYMRDLLLDQRNGDVWVAGWPGIARLRESQGKWTREYWLASPRPSAAPKNQIFPTAPSPKRKSGG